MRVCERLMLCRVIEKMKRNPEYCRRLGIEDRSIFSIGFKPRGGCNMAWDYAELSKAAKENGGPAKFIDKIIEASKSKGRKEMSPWLGVAAVGGAGLFWCGSKLVEYFRRRGEESQKDLENARAELIAKIEEYNAEHPDNAVREDDDDEDADSEDDDLEDEE